MMFLQLLSMVRGCELAPRYGDNNNFTRLLRRVAALSLVPPEGIENVWLNAH